MFFSFNSRIVTLLAIALIVYMFIEYKQKEPINSAFDDVSKLSDKSAPYVIDLTKDAREFSWYEKMLMYFFKDRIKKEDIKGN